MSTLGEAITAGQTEDLEESHRQVGRFLSGFAYLEYKVEELIAAALKLDNVQQFILCANLQSRQKKDVALTLLGVSGIASFPTYETALNRIFALSDERNIVAHSPFWPMRVEGKFFVKFMRSTTRAGKLKLPEILWSVETFDKYAYEMIEIGMLLDRAIAEVNPKTVHSGLSVLQGVEATGLVAGVLPAGLINTDASQED